MLFIPVRCRHSSEKDEVVPSGSKLEIGSFNPFGKLEVVNGKDRLLLIPLNRHFVPSVVVQILGGGAGGGGGEGGGGRCGDGQGRRRPRIGRWR